MMNSLANTTFSLTVFINEVRGSLPKREGMSEEDRKYFDDLFGTVGDALQKLTAELNNGNRGVAEEEKENVDLRFEVAQKRVNENYLSNKIKFLEGNKETLENQLKATDTEINKLKMENTNLKNQIVDLKKDNDVVKKENSDLKNRVTDLENKNKNLVFQLNNTNLTLDTLIETANKLKEQNVKVAKDNALGNQQQNNLQQNQIQMHNLKDILNKGNQFQNQQNHIQMHNLNALNNNNGNQFQNQQNRQK